MRGLLIPTLLLARKGWGLNNEVASSATTVKLQHDAHLEAPLQQLLKMPLEGNRASDLDARMQRAFIQCRELGVTSIMYEVASDASVDDVAYCNRLRYVRHQRQHVRNMRTALASHRPKANVERQVETRVAEHVDFQEFFEHYAEKERPLMMQLKEDGKVSVEQFLGLETLSDSDDAEKSAAAGGPATMENFLSTCFEQEFKMQGGIELLPLRIENEACGALLKNFFRVPIYMTHDYVQRTNASQYEPFLPALVHLPFVSEAGLNASPSAEEVVACPYGLHMLAVLIGDGARMRVSLIDRKFDPINRSIPIKDKLQEVVIEADADVAISAEGSTILDTDYFRHVPELYSAAEVHHGNILFIPGGVISTMRSLASSTSAVTRVLRFCYCDAANVKEVKQAAGLDVLLMTSDNKDEGVHALLHALQTPGFDSSFSRRPTASDTRWKNYVKWPRDPAYLAKKNRRHKPNEDDEHEETQLSRRERLKQWQDDKRWERYIASLTLPVAWPPLVVNTTRSTATLRWQELYQPLKNDVTSYGYEVSWLREDQGGTMTKNPQMTHEAVNVTYDHLKRSRMPSTLFGDDFDGRDLEAVISGLQAETAYSFSVRLLVGDTRGATSGASRRAMTSSCSPPSRSKGVPEIVDSEGTCVTLRWLDVEDDGGKKIELFLISTAKMLEKKEKADRDTTLSLDNTALVQEFEKIIAVNASVGSSEIKSERWASGALWLSARVCGLIPGAAYMFRVAAMNELGAGHWSHWSSRVEMIHPNRRLASSGRQSNPQTVNIPMLKGVGDPGYTVVSGVHILSQKDLSALVAQDPHSIFRASGTQDEDAISTHVVLSDVQEHVQLMNKSDGSMTVERKFEAWTGHYSPRLFDVSAELLLADPPDASQPLRNALAIRDRIVLAIRGKVPFVFKVHFAQQAGALGLIIADASGTCAGGFDQSCVPGADKTRGEGFAAQDQHVLWRRAQIPCVLVLRDAAQELLTRLGSKANSDFEEMAT